MVKGKGKRKGDVRFGWFGLWRVSFRLRLLTLQWIRNYFFGLGWAGIGKLEVEVEVQVEVEVEVEVEV